MPRMPPAATEEHGIGRAQGSRGVVEGGGTQRGTACQGARQGEGRGARPLGAALVSRETEVVGDVMLPCHGRRLLRRGACRRGGKGGYARERCAAGDVSRFAAATAAPGLPRAGLDKRPT